VHVWASFLKLWLRELKTPLIDGEEAYASAIDAATTHLDNIRAAEEAAEQALVSASQSDLRKPRATSMGDMNAIAAAAAAAVAAEESERSPPLRTVKRPPFASSFDALILLALMAGLAMFCALALCQSPASDSGAVLAAPSQGPTSQVSLESRRSPRTLWRVAGIAAAAVSDTSDTVRHPVLCALFCLLTVWCRCG